MIKVKVILRSRSYRNQIVSVQTKRTLGLRPNAFLFSVFFTGEKYCDSTKRQSNYILYLVCLYFRVQAGADPGGPRGPGPPPPTTKNEAPAPKFYKTGPRMAVLGRSRSGSPPPPDQILDPPLAGEKLTDVLSHRSLVCDKTEDCVYKVYQRILYILYLSNTVFQSFAEFREIFFRNSLVLLIFPVRLVFLITHDKV